jgi:hypothetical protein
MLWERHRRAFQQRCEIFPVESKSGLSSLPVPRRLRPPRDKQFVDKGADFWRKMAASGSTARTAKPSVEYSLRIGCRRAEREWSL